MGGGGRAVYFLNLYRSIFSKGQALPHLCERGGEWVFMCKDKSEQYVSHYT